MLILSETLNRKKLLFASATPFLIKIDITEISNVKEILCTTNTFHCPCVLQYVPISRVCFALDNIAKLLKKTLSNGLFASQGHNNVSW